MKELATMYILLIGGSVMTIVGAELYKDPYVLVVTLSPTIMLLTYYGIKIGEYKFKHKIKEGN